MAAVLSTSFAAPVTDWATAWTLASVTGVQIGHLCAAESELAQVTAVGPGTTVTVRRGVEGSAVSAHAARTPVAIYVAGEVDTDAPVLGSTAVALRQATVRLTDAQIKALPTTPVLVVAAPGAHRLITPTRAVARVSLSGGAYLLDAGASWLLMWGSSYYATSPVPMTNVLDGSIASDVTVCFAGTPILVHEVSFPAVVGATKEDTETIVNEPLRLIDEWNGVAPYTGGHATNWAQLSVLYGVLDVGTGLWV